jgi:hypothetical protein
MSGKCLCRNKYQVVTEGGTGLAKNSLPRFNKNALFPMLGSVCSFIFSVEIIMADMFSPVQKWASGPCLLTVKKID